MRKRGRPFSWGGDVGCSFYIKKLKSEIFNDNLNWEILTKNLVTFKRWDGVKDEKF